MFTYSGDLQNMPALLEMNRNSLRSRIFFKKQGTKTRKDPKRTYFKILNVLSRNFTSQNLSSIPYN